MGAQIRHRYYGPRVGLRRAGADSVQGLLGNADNARMRSRLLLLMLALVAAACGEPAPVAAPSTTFNAAPATPITSTTTAAPSATSTTEATTTLPPEGSRSDTYREEWLVETNRGEITAQGEHAGDAHRRMEQGGHIGKLVLIPPGA